MSKDKTLIFLITYSDGHHQYQRYFIGKNGYCGDRRMRKILNMLHFAGQLMSDEDYKEFVVNLENRVPFEIEDVEIIRNAIEL